MMHFNPLNIVNLGGNKIQHPEATRSNTISRNVEAAHKDFLSFQLRLKNLVMLYKTRHQLIDSLNENGLYVSIPLWIETTYVHDERSHQNIVLLHYSRLRDVMMRFSMTLLCRSYLLQAKTLPLLHNLLRLHQRMRVNSYPNLLRLGLTKLMILIRRSIQKQVIHVGS